MRINTSAGRSDFDTLFQVGAIGRLSDAELLARFVEGRGDRLAQTAFAALVDRHGPMVLGLCRRVTGDSHTAEDAFQATFLVLARKAGSIRVDGSLGRWLHGVGLRIARRASRESALPLGDHDPIDLRPALDPCERDDLARVIDEEIARLPDRYRSAAVLCWLEGMSQEQAARRLRCPLGTVQSRLHRAKERLRSGLTRRGVGPSSPLIGAFPALTSAALPKSLVNSTSFAASRLASGQTLAGLVPAAALSLAASTLGSLSMRIFGTAAVLAMLGLSGLGIVAFARSGQVRQEPAPIAQAPTEPKKLESLAEKLGKIQAEYEARSRTYHEAADQAKTAEEKKAIARKLFPDLSEYIHRAYALAATEPKNPAVRDAATWAIMRTSGYQDHGVFAGEVGQAVGWLLRYHGDDPDAVCVGLELNNVPDANRDMLLLGFMATAQSRDSKGLARLALAQYLETKAKMARWARKLEGRPKITLHNFTDDDGKTYDKVIDQSDVNYAYDLHLKQCDADFLDSEVERLYDEVIAEYADVPYRSVRDQDTRKMLAEPVPSWNGKPLTEEEIRKARQRLENKPTLGQVAEARLDDRHNVTVGKPAPEIDASDLSGESRKLSAYRGKVVALVFWGTWCGPCMREIPHEKALAEKMQGRPFAMLGVNTDADPEAARKAMAESGISWPNWHDGEPGEGPIVRRFHIRSYPTIYVIDAEGKIRSKKSIGESLDKLVETLVAEAEAKADDR